MFRRKAFIAVAVSLVLVIGFSTTVAMQQRIDAVQQANVGENLLYLPNDKLMTHLTAGMDSVIADMLWLKCIQYTAEHYRGDQEYVWLQHMITMITRLDPYFVAAYRYGGIFLTMLKRDDDAGIEILKQGMVKNPFAWELPYEIAMTYLLNRPEQPDSPIQAAKFLGMAVATGRAPEFVTEVAYVLQTKHDLLDVERSMWENSLRTGDKFLKELAERKLVELDLRETCRQLDKAVAMYSQRHGRSPGSLKDLVSAGIIRGLPEDPLGGRFYIDVLGKVVNTTVLDERTTRLRGNIEKALKSFERRMGRFPETLQELIDDRGADVVPAHPYADRAWQYDPNTGRIE